MKPPLIVIAGPTAVGKTDLSLKLAGAIGGEIISADSMQVYRHMDIGSAKVTREEMGDIPHHLIDVLEPDQPFNVTVFQSLAKEALAGIYERGRIPVVAGGTGFYIQALLYDIDFQENPKEEETGLRRELERLGEERGNEFLHRMLQEIDPESAAAIHENNRKRVIRAIEYFRQTGEKISLHNQEEREKESPYSFLYYVLYTERQQMYDQIDRRVDLMMEHGLAEEVRRLKSMGCTRDMVSMQGLGYKEMLDWLEGRISLEEAVYRIKRDTRHFAKRQLTWFRRERQVNWIYLPDYGNDRQKVLDQILEDMKKNGIGNIV